MRIPELLHVWKKFQKYVVKVPPVLSWSGVDGHTSDVSLIAAIPDTLATIARTPRVINQYLLRIVFAFSVCVVILKNHTLFAQLKKIQQETSRSHILLHFQCFSVQEHCESLHMSYILYYVCHYDTRERHSPSHNLRIIWLYLGRILSRSAHQLADLPENSLTLFNKDYWTQILLIQWKEGR